MHLFFNTISVDSILTNKSACVFIKSFFEKQKFSPIDDGKGNKNSVYNFRPLIMVMLDIFSKIFEAVIKSQIVLFPENVFLPFLSVYRENYSTQIILIRLIEEWRNN